MINVIYSIYLTTREKKTDSYCAVNVCSDRLLRKVLMDLIGWTEITPPWINMTGLLFKHVFQLVKGVDSHTFLLIWLNFEISLTCQIVSPPRSGPSA